MRWLTFGTCWVSTAMYSVYGEASLKARSDRSGVVKTWLSTSLCRPCMATVYASSPVLAI